MASSIAHRLLTAPLLVLALGAADLAAQPVTCLEGGAFNTVSTIHLEGPANAKYLLMISVINAPGISFIPNINYDVGSEFLDLSLFVLPGFLGTLNASGKADAFLFLPHFVELETFPLYLQLLHTGPTGNALVDKSNVHIWTGQFQDTWKAPFTGSDFSVERSVHTVTTLDDGKQVLITGGNPGGITGAFGQDTAEIYDPRDETLTVLTNTMVQARTGHSATLLQDGRVLLVGGADEIIGEPTNAAEVYDPGTQSFSAVGDLVTGTRALHRANLLPDGRVLITGGTDNFIAPLNIIMGTLNTSEIFDPVTNTFSAGPLMTSERLGHTATSLPNGDVLIVGGYDLLFGILPNISQIVERYTFSAGASGSFASTGFTFIPRFGHEARLLADGSVFVAGGATDLTDPLDPDAEPSWELWTQATGFSDTGALNAGRILPGVNEMPDGRVLISGGADGTFLIPLSIASSEIWDPVTQSVTAGPDMATDRAGHITTSLSDGTVLVTGGGTGNAAGAQAGLTSLEIYQP